MKTTIAIAKTAAMATGARQVVLVAFDGAGRYGVVSYGETKKECRDVARLCDAIADGLRDGSLPAPEVTIATWCPQCGPAVAVDEDGCCKLCGSTATGPGADAAIAQRSEWRDRPPTAAEVAAHEEAWPRQRFEGGVWMCRDLHPDGVLWLPRMEALKVVKGGVSDLNGGWPHQDYGTGISWRPCTPDGTPVPWPEVTA